ncbi:hypothetical protein L218DRAFT_966970 [Marasmius fiardii PR-910]|nr:hypothetical protein L218DRAFT_966970 [Marasmius fiardii PR-910]
MSANDQIVAGPGQRDLERVGGELTPERKAYVLRLRETLISNLASHNSRDVFLIALVGTTFGILTKAKVNDVLETHGNCNTVLSQKQEVALLLCEAVFLFVHSCSKTTSNDPIAQLIWNKNRGEDLAKRVFDDGLRYIVHPHTFEIFHFTSAYQYFQSKLKKDLQKAKVVVPEDIETAAKRCLAS